MGGRRGVGARGDVIVYTEMCKGREGRGRKSRGEIASPPRPTLVGTCSFRDVCRDLLRVRD